MIIQFAIAFLPLLSPALASWAAPQTVANAQDVTAVVESARKYCAKMDQAALDFICLEKVKEESNTRRGPVGTAVVGGVNAWGQSTGLKTKAAPPESFNTMTSFYDYMYVRKGGEVTEKRDLLKKNGVEIEQNHANVRGDRGQPFSLTYDLLLSRLGDDYHS